MEIQAAKNHSKNLKKLLAQPSIYIYIYTQKKTFFFYLLPFYEVLSTKNFNSFYDTENYLSIVYVF